MYLNDKLTGWAGDRYKAGSKGADRQAWLSFWSGAPVLVNRKSRKDPIVLNNPFISVTGCLPPEVLPDLSDERGREDGFVHRLLFSYPNPLPGAWTKNEIDPATIDAAVAVFDKFWELQPDMREEEPVPKVCRFTAGAKALWVQWFTEHVREQAAEDFPKYLKGPWAKMEGYCVRLALILHLCRCAAGESQSEVIHEESMAGAWALIHYFKSHARRVYARLRTTREDERAEHALAWIGKQATQQATARDLLRHHVAGLKTASAARALLQDLVFANEDGNPMEPNNKVKREFLPSLRRAGLRHVPFHSLRHTFTALLIAQGENIKYIQSQLGHASVQTTLDRYGHLLPATHKEAAQRLDQTLFGAPVSKPLANGSVVGVTHNEKALKSSTFQGFHRLRG